MNFIYEFWKLSSEAIFCYLELSALFFPFVMMRFDNFFKKEKFTKFQSLLFSTFMVI